MKVVIFAMVVLMFGYVSNHDYEDAIKLEQVK